MALYRINRDKFEPYKNLWNCFFPISINRLGDGAGIVFGPMRGTDELLTVTRMSEATVGPVTLYEVSALEPFAYIVVSPLPCKVQPYSCSFVKGDPLAVLTHNLGVERRIVLKNFVVLSSPLGVVLASYGNNSVTENL